MSTLSVVVLAAGLGERLGRPFPKPLTPVKGARSMLGQQWDSLHAAFPDSTIHIVVGFKKELIMEEFPDAVFVYNPDYSETNTAKSLVRALRHVHEGGVLWLNGDVVFDPQLLEVIRPAIEAGETFVCVNHARVAEEEVKYTVDEAGNVKELSKQVEGALGEAVGINFVAGPDLAALVRQLEACDDRDYFERGIEVGIATGELAVKPLDVSRYKVMEVDTEDDLQTANATFEEG